MRGFAICALHLVLLGRWHVPDM